MPTVDEQLASLDIFSGLTKAELRKVRKLMTPVDMKAGRTFITEGAVGREAFIILSGRATVRRGARVVATVGPGDVLGEMSVLSNRHRSASVTADTDVSAEVLDKREFSALLDEQPKLTRKLLVSVITRLQELEPSIVD